MNPVFIGSAFVAKYPEGGGNFWVPLQYLLGLCELGIDAWWLEVLWPQPSAARAREFIATFLGYVTRAGVADRVAVVFFPENERDDPPGRAEHFGGLGAKGLWARARDGLLLNFAHSLPATLRPRFARTVLFDIDPGPFQIWARDHDLGVGGHDAYVTIGQNLGAPDCPVPVDVPWQRVWPAVHLPAWPAQESVAGERYTTVTQWWSGVWLTLGDELIDGSKRMAFLDVLELPGRVPVALELAANIHPDEVEERERLARHGWSVVDPAAVAGTPEDFRRYVQRSRGEFSCAKPAYVRTRPGWVSDRTVCYLASGRPCVVQDTGAGRYLPPNAGLRFFRTLEEAAEELRAVERNYRTAASAARALAEEVFSTRAVLPRLLRAAGA